MRIDQEEPLQSRTEVPELPRAAHLRRPDKESQWRMVRAKPVNDEGKLKRDMQCDKADHDWKSRRVLGKWRAVIYVQER